MNLVIGASGQVGSWLMKYIDGPVIGTGYTHVTYPLTYLDITDKQHVRELITDLLPTVVYLPAGQVNADYCEHHEGETDLVNIWGVLAVAQAVKAIGSKLVFFSSDYLFDGEVGLYSEIDEPHPLNVYGRQKQIAEMIIRNEGVDHLIVRTCGVFSWEPQGKNFVMRLLKNLRAGTNVQIPDDTLASPTYAPDLVQTVIELVKRDATGIYNVAGRGWISRSNFARQIAAVFGLDQGLITPNSSDQLGQAARRPHYGGLDINKAQDFLGHPFEYWLSGVRRMAKVEEIQV